MSCVAAANSPCLHAFIASMHSAPRTITGLPSGVVPVCVLSAHTCICNEMVFLLCFHVTGTEPKPVEQPKAVGAAQEILVKEEPAVSGYCRVKNPAAAIKVNSIAQHLRLCVSSQHHMSPASLHPIPTPSCPVRRMSN